MKREDIERINELVEENEEYATLVEMLLEEIDELEGRVLQLTVQLNRAIRNIEVA